MPVLDQVGAEVAARPATRIVALAPDVVELAFALGVGGAVVGAPAAADHPAAARTLPRIDPSDAESILSRAPDLVLATTAGSDPRLVERLRSLGVRVFTTDVRSCVDLADACGRLEAALALPSSGLGPRLASRCDQATARAAALPTRGALFVIWWDPLMVAAPGTFHDDLLTRARLVNLAPEKAGRYPRVDPEVLLDPRLDVVITTDEAEVRAGATRTRQQAWGKNLSSGAVRVVELPAGPASRPGPRLPDALEALVEALAVGSARP